MILSLDPIEAVFEYHDRTKHHLSRYAAGPGGLDWADQPEPFRRFKGCEKIELPKPGADLPVSFSDLSRPERIPLQPLTMNSLGLLLELAFGLSAWKQYGSDRWALRCNPSSGNLHPTEAYLVNADASLLPQGVYHYVSHDHALEKRCEFSEDTQISGVYMALTSIQWREAWKYGERAYRYCQHDTGHALASLRYAAAALGWSVELIAECGDDELAHLLGLDHSDDFIEREKESPDLICRIHHRKDAAQKTDINDVLKKSANAVWYGQAERLSKYHMNHWPVIDEVDRAALKPHTDEPDYRADHQPLPDIACHKSAACIIRQRRSAQRFDGQTSMPLADFNRLLCAILPANTVPFDVWRWPPSVHLLLFVHRVEYLRRGLYLLPRSPEAVDALQAVISFNKEYDGQWDKVEDMDAPLYRLIAADCRRAAKTICCHQDIASDGAFSVAMLADYADMIEAAPWNYRRLFWETGMIGQVLYLEAEAAGLRGTGIGCFFDDSMHDVLGFKDNRFQSLYHFTVGGPLEDMRLQTLPPYGHLDRK